MLFTILFIPNSLHHGDHADGDHDDDDDQVTDHRHQLDSKLASLLRIVVEDSTRFELLLYLPLVKILTDQDLNFSGNFFMSTFYSSRTKQGLDSLYRRLVTLLVLRFWLSYLDPCPV